MMRVAIVGLGGVGGYIAGSFHRAGIDTVGIARGKHLSAIKTNGLTVIEDTEKYNVALKAEEFSGLSGVFDIVLFCVKSYDLKNVAQLMQKHVTHKTIVVSFSNGIDNSSILKDSLDVEVLDGTIYILSSITDSGVIKKIGKVFMAIFSGDGSKQMEMLFQRSGLRYKNSDNIYRDLWKKYIFISAFAMLTSYYNLSIYNVVIKHEEIAKNVLMEIAQVAKIQGVDIEQEVQKSLEIAKNLPQEATTSMHKDFLHKRDTELETLVGYLVVEAQKNKIVLPKIEQIYSKLKENIS